MPGRDILFFVPKAWRQPEPLYQVTDDEALKETQDGMAAPSAGDDSAHAGALDKDADVAGAMCVSVERQEKLKKAVAAAGRRPRDADDSAHAGKQGVSESQLL
jgi:hypothetical protein